MRAPLVDRYLVPLGVVPVTAASVGRVGRSVRASFRTEDTAGALPARVTFGVSAALTLEDFARVYDAIRPVYLTFVGPPDPLLLRALPALVAHAAGACPGLVTDGRHLDAGRAYALLGAGLARMTVTLGAEGGDDEPVFRNIERFVAMRDANRKPGPEIGLHLPVTVASLPRLGALVILCHHRFTNIVPTFGLPESDATAEVFEKEEALAELGRVRVLAEGYGFRRTVGAIDAVMTQLTAEGAAAACYAPWHGCVIGADGEVYPCGPQARRGPSVGNALRAPFSEVWEGAAMQAFRARLRERRGEDAVCAGCRHEDGPLDHVFRVAGKMPGLGRRA